MNGITLGTLVYLSPNTFSVGGRGQVSVVPEYRAVRRTHIKYGKLWSLTIINPGEGGGDDLNAQYTYFAHFIFSVFYLKSCKTPAKSMILTMTPLYYV